MAGRFLPQRDLDVFTRVNRELIGDLKSGKDGIINQQVVLYKISTHDTMTNLYGEAASGKTGAQDFPVAAKVHVTGQGPGQDVGLGASQQPEAP